MAITNTHKIKKLNYISTPFNIIIKYNIKKFKNTNHLQNRHTCEPSYLTYLQQQIDNEYQKTLTGKNIKGHQKFNQLLNSEFFIYETENLLCNSQYGKYTLKLIIFHTTNGKLYFDAHSNKISNSLFDIIRGKNILNQRPY